MIIQATVSQENVELVTRLQVPPDVDIAGLFRSDEAWSALTDAFGGLFHPDCETVAPGVPGTERAMQEVKVDGSAVWTVRDGKIARAEFFTHRADAFQAAGLPQQRS